MLHFPLCREYVIGMPRTEIEFKCGMVVCFCISLAPYAVVFTRIYHHHIVRPVESERHMSVRPPVLP